LYSQPQKIIKVKSLLSYLVHVAEMISWYPSQKPARAARPWTQDQCVARCACLLPQLTTAWNCLATNVWMTGHTEKSRFFERTNPKLTTHIKKPGQTVKYSTAYVGQHSSHYGQRHSG